MKHILYIIIVLSIIFTSGCTIVFKAKEIELDAEPVLSYHLDTIKLFPERMVSSGLN